MLTLHSTTQTIKKYLKWGGIGLGALLVLFLLFRGGIAVFNLIFPKAPPAPTVIFGKLPPLLFPDDITKKELTYTLDTISGSLPTFEDRITVLPIVNAEPTLLNLENARASVGSVGFTLSENVITDTVYQWTNDKKSDKKMIRNIVSNDFTLNSNYFSYPEVLAATSIPTEQEAKTIAKQFLDNMGLFPADIDEERTSTQLLAIQNATIFPASSLSTAQLIRVDFFQKAVNEIPIYYPRPPFSTMHFFVGAGDSRGQIVQGQYYHQAVSEEQATYPLKTPQKAYAELQAGKGYIGAYYGTSDEVIINEVYLAYYLGEEKQEYLMPIIVFEGKEGFFGYISAISDEWINESPPAQPEE